MAYTTQQLVDIYTRANAGAAPSAATRLTLDAYAQQTQPGGGLSEQAALNQTLSLVNNTTAVAVATYQFFNGAAPSAAGLTYLLNSSTNANDLNDTTGVYGSFNQDSRFINFSINLALAGTNAAAFATSYGSPVTFRETVASAYDKIIGNAVATAAGNNVTDAVNWFSRQANIDALTGFVRANNPTFTAAQIDLAVKAAVIGQILSTAVSTGLGIYAGATRAAITDLSDDGVITGNTDAGLNIIAAYPGAGGGVVGKTFALTGDIDTLVGTGNDDTFTGSVGGATNTVNALDSIDGGAGVDTLILSDAAGTATLNTAALAVKNVEVVNLTSATGLLNGTLNTTGWTGLTAANVTVGAPAADQAITAGAGTAVSLTAGNVGGNDLSVDGGSAVTVKTTAQGAGTISVGSVTAPAGVVSVSTVGAYADGANTALGTITVKGGTSVSVAQASGITAAQVEAAKADVSNFTVAQAAVNVTGTSTTTSVSVTQSAAVTEVDSTGTDGVIGVTTGAVTITDVNAGDATKAGTITTVTLANGSQTVASNALTTLNVSGTNTTSATLVAGASTSKALTVNLAGGTTNLTEGNGNLTSITVNATANGTFGLTAAGVVTANLGGSKALTFNPTSVAALKTVNISGAGGVTSVLTPTGVTKIDASTSTGANSITLNGATTKIAYIGGTGSDTVRIANTLDANASIQLGAGNDRLLAGAAGVIGASTTAVVDGGDGIDAISSALISAVNASVFKNFEVLNLQSTGADIVDVSLLTGSTITGLELNGGTGSASYTNLTTAQSLAVTGTSTGGTATLLFNGVAGTADSYAISFNANVTGTASSPTTVNAQTVSVAGIENLSIASGSAAGVASNVIALTDAAARTLTITGSQALTVNFTGAFGTTGANGVNIDASAATGSIKLGATGGLVALGTVDGGSQIKTGAGADVITVGALTNTQQVILTTGGGKDVIDVSTTVGTFGSGATAAALVTVTDFSATDSLVFAAGNGTEVFTSTKVDLTGVNDFAAALTAATTASGAVNSQITWFNYGGNTYIVENNDGAGFNTATDIVVKMTGTLDLSTAVFNATTNTFSLV